MPEPLPLRRIGVFCGSNTGADPVFRRSAAAFGAVLVARGLGLVYGGGAVGLMGVLADTVLAGGGEVVGVIPRSLVDRELAHHGVTDLQIVDGMHERKRRIYTLSDAVVALPGGAGTLDELFEAFTWNQLGIHFRPTGLLNVAAYFDPLIAMLDRMVDRGFLRRVQRDWLVVADEGPELLTALGAVRPTIANKWIAPSGAPGREPEET